MTQPYKKTPKKGGKQRDPPPEEKVLPEGVKIVPIYEDVQPWLEVQKIIYAMEYDDIVTWWLNQAKMFTRASKDQKEAENKMREQLIQVFVAIEYNAQNVK